MSEKPPQWYEVYPQGSPEGDEEFGFWVALTRNRWRWVSVASLAAESGLTELRCEEILYKYSKMGMVIQNPDNEWTWGYWESHPDLIPKKRPPLVQQDRAARVSKIKRDRAE